jgi:hypothetical protein
LNKAQSLGVVKKISGNFVFGEVILGSTPKAALSFVMSNPSVLDNISNAVALEQKAG